MILDWLIRGAEVYDGNGGPPKMVSVGIHNGRIALVGEDPGDQAAKQIIDGTGLWLSPGFIDSHASTGLGYFFDHAADHKLYQGVTMELIGNCGTSPGPVGPHLNETMNKLSGQIGFPFNWSSLGEYFSRVEDIGLPINLATLVGHSTLRGGAMENWKELQDGDLKSMCDELDQAMQQGAFGMSSGLIYPPGCYAEIDELIELGKVVAAHGGFYASHIRDEREGLEEAVNEALEIGRGSKIPVLVSHLKAADRQNWGKIPGVIRDIETFREEHDLDVIVDVYPYTAVSTKLRAFLPKDILKDGIEAVSVKLKSAEWRQRCYDWLAARETDFSSVIVISEDIPGTVGLTVEDIARNWNKPPAEAACDLVQQNPETWMVYHCISQEDMDTAILWKDAIVCSDSWSYPPNAPNQIGNPHPRTYGAFSHFLRRYVFERNLLSYGDAVRKITSMSADFIGLKQRGRICEGYHADVLLMDPKTFADKATYQNPRQFSEGVAWLWVNGRLTIQEGEIVNVANGRILRPKDV